MKDNESKRPGLSKPARVFARSLLIGGSWNYSKLQNVGFLYSIGPAAESFPHSKDILLSRHIDTFSTHPVMASLIAASVLKGEETNRGEAMAQLKRSLAGPYAAMGDPFFWGALRPVCSILAVSAVALWGSLFAPIIAIILYNIVHLSIRTRGFIEAYREGVGGVKYLQRVDMPEKAKHLRWLSLCLLAGLAGGVLTVPLFQDQSVMLDIFEGLFMLCAALGCLWLIEKRVSIPVILYGASIIFFLVAS